MINANDEKVEGEEIQANDTEDESGTDGEASEAEAEGEDSVDTSDDEGETVSVSRTDYEKLQREAAAAKRLREAKLKDKKEQGTQHQEGAPTFDQELIERTFLAAQVGVQDPDIQDEAIRLAKKFGMNIAQAVADPDIKTRLDNLTKDKKAKNAVAQGTGGSSSKARSAAYYAAEYERSGKLPDDPAMVSQVLDLLAGKK